MGGHKMSASFFIFAAKTYINVYIMVKNWIILGDEAFEGSESTWGRIELSKEQQSKWQNIVMEQLNSAIEKSAKVREMIDNSNIIECDFDFFEKPKVTEEEVAEFMKRLEDRFKDKTVFYKVSYNREFSWVFIDFMNVNIHPEEEEKIYIDENGNPMPNSNGMTVPVRNLAGEWTEYEYRDVKGKVEKDDQYKIILKGKEYKLEGIKHPNENNYYHYLMDDEEDNLKTEDFMRDNYSSRELTTALKRSFLYFAEVDQNTIIAMPDENYIKEYIEGKRECFENAIKNGKMSGLIIVDRRAYHVLDFCLSVLDIIESKEAKTIIEQWEREKFEDGERAIQEILNSDSKDLNEKEIEQLLNTLK